MQDIAECPHPTHRDRPVVAKLAHMSTSSELVTVYIPTRNRVDLLRQALASVEAQTYPHIEVIVVDDGSDDGTAVFLASYESRFPFRWFRNGTPLGANAARNNAIHHARGRFLTGLDDDDRFHPDRIRTLMAAWDERWSMVTSDDILTTATGDIRWRKKRVISADDLLFRNRVGNQVLTLRDRVMAVGLFDETLTAAQDHDLWIRLALRFGDAMSVPEALQTVRATSAGDRITKNRNTGYYDLYRKHKGRMSRAQRAYHLYAIRRQQGKRHMGCRFMSWVPLRFMAMELRKAWLRI
jgi:glycosyltransferase involved in cell wall biosynthesis